jgi:hypothetical protein
MNNRVRLRLDFQVEHINLNLLRFKNTMMAKIDVHSFSISKQNTLNKMLFITNSSLDFKSHHFIHVSKILPG